MSMRQGLILEVINLHLQHLIYPWREHGGEAVLFPSICMLQVVLSVGRE